MDSLEEYKSFIDDAVATSRSMQSNWCLQGKYPDTAENSEINELLSTLNKKQLLVLSAMLERAKESGVHDLLALIHEKQILGNLEIYTSKSKLPVEPFGTEMHYDFISRKFGDDWPEL
ncbi:DUF6547 family protein [Alteromonas sp. KUL49]|uniref:DUF6547 family protein n=1 Tax=Alteromonas sp. KUL49 TaxID=2480798 RepID=UPI00102F088A|nr:DUF6547 family protein [Alteromonas sp. KUL49]TAP40711.1 hypothetical protein EYS00_06230 [Alteromonas sp. KUL49]GEA10880.1 hypothetical protein KUL49_12550 [Alteromonas sp. KUL49]